MEVIKPSGTSELAVVMGLGGVKAGPDLGYPMAWNPEAVPSEDHLEEMYHLMKAEQGIGLAAPQIGVKNRYFVLDERCYMDRYVVNPIITSLSGADWGVEGCLSFPGRLFAVCRATRVDFTVQGYRDTTQTLNGFAARVFLHEYDHLEGRTLLDYMELR